MSLESRREANRKWCRKRYKEHREKVDAIKLERGCIDCGYREHPAALEFDHVKGKKKFKIAAMLMCRWEVILEEIAKCVVRCANCHVIKTVKNGESKGRPRIQSVASVAGGTVGS